MPKDSGYYPLVPAFWTFAVEQGSRAARLHVHERKGLDQEDRDRVEASFLRTPAGRRVHRQWWLLPKGQLT